MYAEASTPTAIERRVDVAPARLQVKAGRSPAPLAEIRLVDGVTSIGSAQICDVVLAGLMAVEADIHHNALDQFVLFRFKPIKGGGVELQSGDILSFGDWTVTFLRDL